MYVSCSGLCCDKSNYPTAEDAIVKIGELGFGATNLAVMENWQHINPSEISESQPALSLCLKESLSKSDLTVSSLNCNLGVPWSDTGSEANTERANRFAAVLDLATGLSSPNITLSPPSQSREKQPVEELLSILIDWMLQASEKASEAGVSLSAEAHANTIIEDPEVAIRFAEALPPSAGITYDPSHFELQGIPLRETEPLLDHARHVHVRNSSLKNMQESMEAGTVDFDWLIPALRSHGYDGPVAIEYFNGFDPDFSTTAALRDYLLQLGVSSRP